MNKNPICEILNIKYPIVQGGLAYVGNGELAAAVSNGGGLGVIGSAGRSPEDFQKQIEIASSKTDKPIGVNLPLSEHSDNTPYINIILDNVDKLSAVSISAGNPNTVMPFFKETKLKILIYVYTIAHAIKDIEICADIVI